MLVVRGREAADPPPSAHRVEGLALSDQKAIEGHREGVRVETPKSPFGQMAMEGEGHRGGVSFFGRHQGGVHHHQEEARRSIEGGWSGGEGKEDGPGPLQM